jgi:salicylate hydroxylase
VLYRALVPIEAVPEIVQTDCVKLWLCPRGHVVHYPVSGGRMMNIVAACAAPISDRGWGGPATASDVLAGLPFAVPALAAILEAAPDWRQWPAADRPPAGRWGEGPVTLIGDAAHPVLPYLAQGAAMALEDAVVLAFCVGREPTPADGFSAYERQRRPRVANLARLSRRQGSVYHLEGPLRLARNAVFAAMPSRLFLAQLDWLYSWQPPDVSR